MGRWYLHGEFNVTQMIAVPWEYFCSKRLHSQGSHITWKTLKMTVKYSFSYHDMEISWNFKKI